MYILVTTYTCIYMYIELLAYYEVLIHFISDKSLTFVTLSWPDLLYSLSEEMVGRGGGVMACSLSEEMVGRGGGVGRRSEEVIPNTPPDSLQLPSPHQTPGHEHTVYSACCKCCTVHAVHALGVLCFFALLFV